MKRATTIAVAVLLFTSMLIAHGNEQHVIGTVTNVSSDSITVHTTTNANVTVMIVSGTQFFKAETPSSAKDLKVGDRVVIHAKKNGEKLEAHTVRIGTAQPAASHATAK